MKGVALLLFTTGLTCANGACQSKNETATEKKLAELKLTPEEAKRLLAELSIKIAEHQAPPPETPEVPKSVAQRSQPSADLEDVPSLDSWIIDALEDIGPAAPSTASPLGVYLVNGANELFLAKLGRLPVSPSPSTSPIGVVPDAKGPFALGRGPALTDTHAYWVTSHFLLRRPTHPPYGPLEIVEEDARVGTRATAVTSASGEAAVAYISLPNVKNGPLRAKLWTEGRPFKTSVDLTSSGNSTLSVALVPQGSHALALSLEARMGVTALHSRSVEEGGKLGLDDVLWIGGTAQPLTEVRALSGPTGWTAFLAMEQDSSHFGLALLSHAPASKTLRETWLTYPNGQDPAPVAPTTACGQDLVLFARPSEAAPKAPQELVLGRVQEGKIAGETVLSRGRAFYDVSLAHAAGGVLVSFVTDQRTWARTVRCAPSPRIDRGKIDRGGADRSRE